MSTKTLKIRKVTIIGVIPSFAFQRAKQYAIELHKSLPQRYPLPEIKGMLEFDWNEKLQEWRRTMDREFWCIRRPVVVFFDDRFIGSDIDLIRTTSYGNTYYENIPRKNMCVIRQEMRDDYYTYLKKSQRMYCYLDICIDDVYVGALTFQLYSDILPQTCDHFKELCFERYKGSIIHRVVKNGWIQGGKFKKCKLKKFKRIPDENYGMSHNRRGIISMVSDGKNNISSQFFISLKPLPWLDGYFVAFGQLIEGAGALEAIENVETCHETPLQKIEIRNSGELVFEEVKKIGKKLEEIEVKGEDSEKLETIAEQLIRLIMEAVTACLVIKEHPLDVLDERDVPSEMDLNLYFQGFYSIPWDIVEEVAAYIRQMKRDLLRNLNPAAAEAAEIFVGNVLTAVVTNLTTLDDVRETLGHALYDKMIKNIDMNIEGKERDHVQKFIDQLMKTGKKIIEAMWRKLEFFRTHKSKYRKFEKQMNKWMNDFVMQKSFMKFFLPVPKPEPKEEQEEEKKKEEEEDLMRDEICGDKDSAAGDDLEVLPRTTAEFFNQCRYELKYPRQPKRKRFLKLLKTSRKKLKELRVKLLYPDLDKKAIEDHRLESKLKVYLTGVQYVPESEWLRDLMFDKKTKVNHVDNIMCGALTVALLEMYYLYEGYLRKVPEEEIREETPPPPPVMTKARKIAPKKKSPPPQNIPPIEEIIPVEELAPEEESEPELEPEPEPEPQPTRQCPSCKCMDSYCDCICDPNWSPDDPRTSSPKTSLPKEEDDKPETPPPLPPPPPPPPSEEPELTEPEEDVKVTDLEQIDEGPCPPGMEPFDIEAILADKPLEPFDIKSFKWLHDYIIDQGCDAKSKLATRVHEWLNGEDFNYSGLLSKHSLATRASILSLSFSLASLIQEDNNFKTEIRNFIYDLWYLYFGELFKETLYENWSSVNPEGLDLDYDYERASQPYSPPFWIKFITGETKRALAVLAKLSAQPINQLRIKPSELAFDEHLKMWLEASESYKKSKPSPEEILEYVSYHKVELDSLEKTVRSYLKNKVISGLMDKKQRKGTAEELANDIVSSVVTNVMKRGERPNGSVESIVKDLITAAIKSD